MPRTKKATPRYSSPDNEAVRTALGEVKNTVKKHFAEASNPLLAALSVMAVGCLEDNSQPTTLIFVAGPGAGKSMVLNFLIPNNADSIVSERIYRSDKFTAASFVSHRADLTEEELNDQDLLPKLKGKTLVTKELAPVFHGKGHELVDRFAMLTSVLDGHGFSSDSGAHGHRGYEERINFQWLGATTPLSQEILDVMTELGQRMLFYDSNRRQRSVDELVDFAASPSADTSIAECTEAVQDFLCTFFEEYPPDSVRTEDIAFDEKSLRAITLWTLVMTKFRATLSTGPEYPERALLILKNVAIGSALIHGRDRVAKYDLKQIAHIALSAGSEKRRHGLIALLANEGELSTPDIERRFEVTAPTATKYIRAIGATDLATFHEATGGRAHRCTLNDDYRDLLGAPLLKVDQG